MNDTEQNDEKEKHKNDNEIACGNGAVITALDGGYGWIVVFASFMANVVVDGIIFTTGEALVGKWQSDFDSTAMQASIAQSLLTGFYLLSGPLSSALANLYGCRIVTIAGAIIACIGFALSAFVPVLSLLYVTFGVIGGIGFGLIYLPSIVIVNQYFEKKRAFALGIAVCGSGIGTTIFSQIFPYLLRICGYNWRMFLFYVAFISLICIFSGLLYVSPKPTIRMEAVDNIEKMKLINEATPSAVENDSVNVEEGEKAKISEANKNTYSMLSSTDHATLSSFTDRHYHSSTELRHSPSQSKGTRSEMDLSKSIPAKNIQEISGPLARKDIFYAGSTSSLQQRLHRRKLSENEELSSPLSPVTNVIVSMKQGGTGVINLKSALRSMFDPELFSNPSFILLAISGFLTLCCLFMPFIYLGEQAVQIGATPEQKSYLILSLGIMSIIGRVICGVIADLPSVDALIVNNVAIIVGGLATCCVPLLTQYWMFVVYTIPFAYAVACFSALRSLICVELLGLDKLSSAFGILMLFMGLAALIGPPIAGFLKDVSGSFNASFYLMGALLTLSGVMCLPLRKLNSQSCKSFQ